jgi:methylated-DNA-[protein]-cysteine S-methyltransferase
MTTYTTTIDSPLGPLTLVASDTHLLAVLWKNDRRHTFTNAIPNPTHPILTQTATQLAEYFGGVRQTFNLPMDPIGTDFQKSVWNALAKIPYAQTTSYAAIARSLDRATASRAVGAAVGHNPLSILLPCHRVLSATGALTGFAGGLPAKQFLLALERPSLLKLETPSHPHQSNSPPYAAIPITNHVT